LKKSLDLIADKRVRAAFAEDFFTIASGFTLGGVDRWWPGAELARIVIAYQPLGGHHLDKHLFIQLEGPPGDGYSYRMAQLLAFIYPSLMSTPFACDNIWLIIPGELKEVTKSSYVATAHDVLKKCLKTISEAELNQLFDKCSVKLSWDKAVKPVALAAASMLFGAHRLGLGVRQVAAQVLAWELLNSEEGLKGLYGSLLASLVVDTYIWLAGMCAAKEAGTIRGELYYALLASDLRRLAKWIRESLDKLPTVIDEVRLSLSRKLADARSLVHVKDVISGVFGEASGLDEGCRRTHELLLGLLADHVTPQLDSLKGLLSVEVDAVIVVTEQVGPGFIKFVEDGLGSRGVKCIRILAFYTMYTYLNRLLTSWYLHDGRIEYRLISASDPDYSFKVAFKALDELAEDGRPIVLLALGPMSVLTPLLKAAARIMERGAGVEIVLPQKSAETRP